MFRYPSPVFPGDEVGGLLDDSYGVPMRPGEDLGNSSIQASGTSRCDEEVKPATLNRYDFKLRDRH